MSIIGILASNLFAAGAQSTQNNQSIQNTPSKFQQIKTEFQQLGQDLESGNLKGAQQDYTTLSQNLSGGGPAATNPATSNPAGANPILQAFAQLGTDLQSGNLQAAQKDFATVQEDAQRNAAQVQSHHGRHHHHHSESAQSSSSVPSSQQAAISAAFGTLGQDLQAGNLSGAQSAFATLASDLQKIGGFVIGGSSGASGAAAPVNTGTLNISA